LTQRIKIGKISDEDTERISKTVRGPGAQPLVRMKKII
jgi:hypothetical protein